MRLLLGLFAPAAFGALTLACLVDVDETLVDRAANAANDAAVDQRASGETGAADAGEAGTYLGLPCGSGHCTPPGEVCCATTFGDPDVTNGKCSTSALCETGDYFGCASPRDCLAGGLGTTLCCVVRDRGAFTKTKCASTCEGATAGLCDPNGAACPAPQTCRPSVEFPHLFECVVL